MNIYDIVNRERTIYEFFLSFILSNVRYMKLIENWETIVDDLFIPLE